MQYRRLGKTGLMVSEIGFGAEWMERQTAQECEAVLKRAEELGGIDLQRSELYKLCEQNDVGLTVMKPYAGGRLFDAGRSPFGVALTPVTPNMEIQLEFAYNSRSSLDERVAVIRELADAEDVCLAAAAWPNIWQAQIAAHFVK